MLHKFSRIILLTVLVLSGHLRAKQSVYDYIDQDYKRGTLSLAERTAYQLMAIREPDKLPERYRYYAVQPTRMMTTLKAQAKALFHHVSEAERELLRSFLTRPYSALLPETISSPQGLFKIHYTTSGINAASKEFATETAKIFDEVYEFQVGVLGYRPPPSDNGIDGPEYDVYMMNLVDYGGTTAEDPVPETEWPDYTSYIEIDNDFVHTQTKGLDAVKVTAAHEFFHMIQIGYRSYTTAMNSIFIYESCAAWMEDMAYDEIDDYLQYVPKFINTAEKPFYETGSDREYGISIFYHMMEKKYGRNVVKRIWQEFQYTDIYMAIEKALNAYKTSFGVELGEFALWNCFTGSRADTIHFYPEGSLYAELIPTKTYEFNNPLQISSMCSQLESRYYRIKMLIQSDIAISPSFEEPFSWIYGVALDGGSGPERISITAGDQQKTFTSVGAETDIWLVATNTNLPETPLIEKEEDFVFKLDFGIAPSKESIILNIAPNPYIVSRHSSIEFRFNLGTYAPKVELYILNEHGMRVKKIDMGHRPEGLCRYEWDGNNEQGKRVISGVYYFIVLENGLLGPEKFAVIH